MYSCIKYIIAIMLIGSCVMAQQRPAIYDYATGQLLSITNNTGVTNVIASGITNYFAPSYGMLSAHPDPYEYAQSVVVTNGTISSGTVTNTWEEDSSYLVINESGVWEVYFTFTNSSVIVPKIIDFHGRYEGTPSHNVKFQLYDYTNGVYSNLTASADDLPSGTTDRDLRFSILDPTANYINTNGESIVKIYHDGVAIGTHNLYVDWLQLTYPTALATNGGSWYPLTGFDISLSNNITIDGANGRIITTSAGDYTWQWSLAFTGLTNSEFTIRHLTNGVASGTESVRTIGSTPQVGSMSALGGARLPSGVTNSWQFKSTVDNAYLVFIQGAAQVRKESK